MSEYSQVKGSTPDDVRLLHELSLRNPAMQAYSLYFLRQLAKGRGRVAREARTELLFRTV